MQAKIILQRTWERGAGDSYPGTGACAVHVAANQQTMVDAKSRIDLRWDSIHRLD